MNEPDNSDGGFDLGSAYDNLKMHVNAQKVSQETVLQEAERLIYGERKADYGDARTEAVRIAAGWEMILGLPVGSIAWDKPALCMVWLKMCRETNKHKRDNLVDMAGYVGLVQKVLDGA